MRSHRTRREESCAPADRLVAVLAVALSGLLAGAPAAAAGAPAGAVARVVAGAAAAPGGTSFPPCIDVEFEAAPLTGRPPITVTWLSDTGQQLTGNPVVIDTADYAGGPHQLTVTAANPWGSDQAVAPFAVEALAASPPAALQNPVPGLQVTVGGTASGYNEWRFVWGDGQVTPWQPACVAETAHTYAAAGTYAVRLEVRNCLAPAVSSAPVLVTVGGTNLAVGEFRVLGCQYGPCVFGAGQILTFVQSFTLPPALLYYDWDGDGAAEEISGLPVAVHAYDDPGSYRPRVTAEWGTMQATRVHAQEIHVSGHPEPIAFYDGFESGGPACWTAVSGVPQPAPGPGCFGVP